MHLLPTDNQTFFFFHADRQNPHGSRLFIDCIKHAKPIARAATDFPRRREGRRLPQGFAVVRLRGWLEAELFADLLPNRGVILRVDSPQMVCDLGRKVDGAGLPFSHDVHYSCEASSRQLAPKAAKLIPHQSSRAAWPSALRVDHCRQRQLESQQPYAANNRWKSIRSCQWH